MMCDEHITSCVYRSVLRSVNVVYKALWNQKSKKKKNQNGVFIVFTYHLPLLWLCSQYKRILYFQATTKNPQKTKQKTQMKTAG